MQTSVLEDISDKLGLTWIWHVILEILSLVYNVIKLTSALKSATYQDFLPAVTYCIRS